MGSEPPTRSWATCRSRGWPPAEDPGGPQCSLSFLTEDGAGDEPLSSTRRSQLEELELGGGCGLGGAWLWPGCPPDSPSLTSPSLIPWPHMNPGGSVLPPQPLASSTWLSAGGGLGEGPQSQTVGGRTRGPPRALPESSTGDSPVPSPQWAFGASGSPQPQHCSRVLGGHRAPPRAPLPHAACRRHGDGDIAQHRPRVPQGPPTGWAGLGVVPLADPNLEVGARGWDCSSLGDSSNATECFVSALETLEPSEARGSPEAQRCPCPHPRAAGGPERGENPSPAGAATRELPLASPRDTERVQDEGFWGGSRAAPSCKGGSEVGDVGELHAQLQGCSLQGSTPSSPGPPHSPVGPTTGDVTPQGQEPPRYRHVTPRTRSRLLAWATRLNASSASSLFDQTLEMPKRPPRLRAPRGVPRDPVSITPQREDVSGGDREGSGSLDDTEILPAAPSQPSSPPGASSSSCSSPTVLLVPGDQGHPQGSPSDPQGSPGSSPTVLLVPGDQGHPQGSPSDPQGSPGSSPTVLLVPGDQGHPQDSPSDPQGSPCAAGHLNPRVLEGGSEWQDLLPLGTPQPLGPHWSFSRLPAPRAPSSTAEEPGSPAVPGSSGGCSTRWDEEHPGDEEYLGDKEWGQAPSKQQSPEAIASPADTDAQDGWAHTVPPQPLSDDALRRWLRALGDNPGPITELTRQLYLRRLEELVRGRRGVLAGPHGADVGLTVLPDTGTATPGHSPELVAALRTGHVPDCAQDELVLAQQFDRPDRSRHWREGLLKSSFNYLLLDPRTTQDLPLRSHRLSPAERFRTFVDAIFYVGKGTRTRPYCHLAEALSQHRAGTQRGCPKVRRILEIWASGQGIISVHCFQNSVPAEAYTRESCLLEALGLPTITNQRRGICYGAAASWPAARRRRLGVHMLHRAMCIFLAEGERQLRPADIQGGR